MSSQKRKSKRRFRRSKLDAYAHIVGRVPDREVAAMAGITPDGVRMYRQRHKIPAYSSFKRTQQPADGGTERKRPAAPARVASESSSDYTAAFSVAVREGDGEQQFIVLASDIVAATRRAVSAAAKRGGEIVRVAYVAETLTA